MNAENNPWNELGELAAKRLPVDFSQRVIARAGQVRDNRRQLTAVSVTLGVCLLVSSLTVGWMKHQQQQENLAEWQSLSTVTLALDRGL